MRSGQGGITPSTVTDRDYVTACPRMGSISLSWSPVDPPITLDPPDSRFCSQLPTIVRVWGTTHTSDLKQNGPEHGQPGVPQNIGPSKSEEPSSLPRDCGGRKDSQKLSSFTQALLGVHLCTCIHTYLKVKCLIDF